MKSGGRGRTSPKLGAHSTCAGCHYTAILLNLFFRSSHLDPKEHILLQVDFSQIEHSFFVIVAPTGKIFQLSPKRVGLLEAGRSRNLQMFGAFRLPRNALESFCIRVQPCSVEEAPIPPSASIFNERGGGAWWWCGKFDGPSPKCEASTMRSLRRHTAACNQPKSICACRHDDKEEHAVALPGG